ncbi:ABC transporter permease [Streptomyces aureus]|uniref:ABC transporter permease n=1 Tax=Streptomyces aureus TaxID=193461 RepID=A0ABV4T1L3_9ACTN
MLGALVALIIAASIVYPGFLLPGNLQIMLTQYAPLGIVSVGMTLVILAGGFDLSVGAIFAGAAVVATSLSPQIGVIPATLIALVMGLALGVVNGTIVTVLGVNPFITTLGTSSLYSGAVLFISDSAAYTNTDESFMWLGNGSLVGIPLSLLCLGVVFIAGLVAMERMRFGRRIYAIGGSREAARLSGIPVNLVQGGTYVISGLLAAFAGVITASQQGSGQGAMGNSLALDAIAVVVIGGTSLRGGEGRMWKTAIGLLILAILDNIFFSLAVDSNFQLVVKGAIVIVAVAGDQLLRRGRQ